MLDMVSAALKRASLRHSRFDGTMSQKAREDMLKQFATDSKLKLLLVRYSINATHIMTTT
jgi:SNF2 family DNA or RNA helicase